ncbi:Nif11-like leader peptide family natural product precursor [Flavivirga rizhaonensis]|uniref:Nif11 family protein n=1 Tax=Flavivirga rizhaonensis TaxID=2559571 RepID=A0A4S1DUP7_9FLAO|nr:Nif11-like leader peptide family natural product precursor [Flavivirga rizhaonensis]TGV01555.1 Nif11 family protein [Flavivirga rizhaonensis]
MLKKTAEDFVNYLIVQDNSKEILSLKNHDQVLELAKAKGYEINLAELQREMKRLVTFSLSRKGVPQWVVDRMSVDVHD